MKKIASNIGLFLVTLNYFVLSVPAYAAPANSICPPSTSQFAVLCDLQLNSSNKIVGSIVTIMLVLAVVLCLFFLVWGAIRWIMSGGDKGKVDAARGTITAAIIGLIIAFLAYFFLNLIVFLFTKNSVNNLFIPTIVP